MTATSLFSRRASVERKHAGTDARKYIAGEDWNFGWLDEEVALVISGWRKGLPVWEIAEEVGRLDEEVVVLVMDLARKKGIEQRPGGMVGSR